MTEKDPKKEQKSTIPFIIIIITAFVAYGYFELQNYKPNYGRNNHSTNYNIANNNHIETPTIKENIKSINVDNNEYHSEKIQNKVNEHQDNNLTKFIFNFMKLYHNFHMGNNFQIELIETLKFTQNLEQHEILSSFLNTQFHGHSFADLKNNITQNVMMNNKSKYNISLTKLIHKFIKVRKKDSLSNIEQILENAENALINNQIGEFLNIITPYDQFDNGFIMELKKKQEISIALNKIYLTLSKMVENQ